MSNGSFTWDLYERESATQSEGNSGVLDGQRLVVFASTCSEDVISIACCTLGLSRKARSYYRAFKIMERKYNGWRPKIERNLPADNIYGFDVACDPY